MAPELVTEPFRPLRRTTLTDQVVRSLRSYIADNSLRPGDRLPTHRELCVSLGVSRNVLREALKSLEAFGLISSRVGDGTYVTRPDDSALMRYMSFAASCGAFERDSLMAARDALELCPVASDNPVLREFGSLLDRLLDGGE